MTEGIPATLPALATAEKLQRKALTVGMALPTVTDDARWVAGSLSQLEHAAHRGERHEVAGDRAPLVSGDGDAELVGELLFSLVNLARLLGVDAEGALASRARRFRAEVEHYG